MGLAKEENGQEIEGKEENDSLFSTPPADTNLVISLHPYHTLANHFLLNILQITFEMRKNIEINVQGEGGLSGGTYSELACLKIQTSVS